MKGYWGNRPIFVGGCVERGEGSSFRAKAHAHNLKSDPHFGWVCFRSMKRVGEVVMLDHAAFAFEVMKPSRTLLHEVAHVLTPGHWHDDTWRRKMREMGQPIPRQYAKRPR